MRVPPGVALADKARLINIQEAGAKIADRVKAARQGAEAQMRFRQVINKAPVEEKADIPVNR